jgi:hypothetical protein
MRGKSLFVSELLDSMMSNHHSSVYENQNQYIYNCFVLYVILSNELL